MVQKTHILHTSRAVDIPEMEKNLSRAYANAAKVRRVTVKITEAKLVEKCKSHPQPHMEYRIMLSYDETDTQVIPFEVNCCLNPKPMEMRTGVFCQNCGQRRSA